MLGKMTVTLPGQYGDQEDVELVQLSALDHLHYLDEVEQFDAPEPDEDLLIEVKPEDLSPAEANHRAKRVAQYQRKCNQSFLRARACLLAYSIPYYFDKPVNERINLILQRFSAPEINTLYRDSSELSGLVTPREQESEPDSTGEDAASEAADPKS